jgi:hypothetical protein
MKIGSGAGQPVPARLRKKSAVNSVLLRATPAVSVAASYSMRGRMAALRPRKSANDSA